MSGPSHSEDGDPPSSPGSRRVRGPRASPGTQRRGHVRRPGGKGGPIPSGLVSGRDWAGWPPPAVEAHPCSCCEGPQDERLVRGELGQGLGRDPAALLANLPPAQGGQGLGVRPLGRVCLAPCSPCHPQGHVFCGPGPVTMVLGHQSSSWKPLWPGSLARALSALCPEVRRWGLTGSPASPFSPGRPGFPRSPWNTERPPSGAHRG